MTDFDMLAHLKRQICFSLRTFGPGARTRGVIDHISKELKEVANATSHIERRKEWVDVVILGFDGLTRELVYQGFSFDEAAQITVEELVAKQYKNEKRDWPDWRTADPGKAIEHVRNNDHEDDGA